LDNEDAFIKEISSKYEIGYVSPCFQNLDIANKWIGKVSKRKATRLIHFILPQGDEIHESKKLNEVGDIRDLENSLEKMVIELHETGK
jgi:hypothetical protein